MTMNISPGPFVVLSFPLFQPAVLARRALLIGQTPRLERLPFDPDLGIGKSGSFSMLLSTEHYSSVFPFIYFYGRNLRLSI